MPIDSTAWNAADPETSEYRDLLAFLRDHPSIAFRPGELVGTISGDFSTAIERERCKMVLETLVELGKVEKRRHADTDLVYYRIAPAAVEGTRSIQSHPVGEDVRESATDGGVATDRDRSGRPGRSRSADTGFGSESS